MRCLRQTARISPRQCIALEHTLIRSQTGCWFSSRSHDIGYLKPTNQSADDGLHNLVLDGKQLRQFPVKFLGPNMAAGLVVDQLHTDADALADPPQAAFDDEA